MVKLLTFLFGVAGSLFELAGLSLARKALVAAAGVSALLVLVGLFAFCINEILGTVLSLLNPPAWIANAVGMFIPPSFGLVLSAIVSAKICRAAYDLSRTKIGLYVKAT